MSRARIVPFTRDGDRYVAVIAVSHERSVTVRDHGRELVFHWNPGMGRYVHPEHGQIAWGDANVDRNR